MRHKRTKVKCRRQKSQPARRYQFEMPGDTNRVEVEAAAVARIAALEDYPREVMNEREVETLAHMTLAALPSLFDKPVTNNPQAFFATFVPAFTNAYQDTVNYYQQDPEAALRDARTLKRRGALSLARSVL